MQHKIFRESLLRDKHEHCSWQRIRFTIWPQNMLIGPRNAIHQNRCGQGWLQTSSYSYLHSTQNRVHIKDSRSLSESFETRIKNPYTSLEAVPVILAVCIHEIHLNTESLYLSSSTRQFQKNKPATKLWMRLLPPACCDLNLARLKTDHPCCLRGLQILLMIYKPKCFPWQSALKHFYFLSWDKLMKLSVLERNIRRSMYQKKLCSYWLCNVVNANIKNA
jgi:hypothetical protein